MLGERGPLPLERGIRQEALLIDSEHLIKDNHSQAAEKARSDQDELKKKGKQTAAYRCGDARGKAPRRTVVWGSLAASQIPTARLASDRGIGNSLVMPHMDLEELQEKGNPVTCGALIAKSEIGDEHHEHGTLAYVSERVQFPDPVLQAVWMAIRIANLSGKPVLAAIQNHLDYDLFPVGLIDPQRSIANADPRVLEALSDRKYNSRKWTPIIYRDNLIPVIDQSFLPDFALELIEQNNREAEELQIKYPDLRDLQKIQRPRMVMLSTDIRSARVRYPVIASVPGSIFRVHVAREKVEGKPRISTEDLSESVKQLHYPISHAVGNYNDSNKPFPNTDRLIIETGDFELSMKLAMDLQKEEWMDQWLSLPDRRIIALQTQGGIVNPNAIHEFTK